MSAAKAPVLSLPATQWQRTAPPSAWSIWDSMRAQTGAQFSTQAR